MKYGLNQWSRISSLLVRKSAKQCKARWYEWLDPSIKKVRTTNPPTLPATKRSNDRNGRTRRNTRKTRRRTNRTRADGTKQPIHRNQTRQTEWTREEDEKLLHLAKLMPTQWRTLAPVVGRTPTQCLERYEQLLDAATQRQEEYDAKDDPRKLRPGEIDPQPETKPARPDAIDMDEDEKEMLAEARARLANTKGKKAKRKAREKQLEEAKRLAGLQKRRELKAAGLYTGERKRKKELDYNAEIVFQKKPPPGFYDVTEETQKSKEKPAFKAKTIEEIEGKRRDDIEQALRKADISRQKIRERHDAPGFIAHQLETNEIATSRKRTKLNLPPPQVTDAEMSEIARLGKLPDTFRSEEVPGTSATHHLLASTTDTPRGLQTPLRTPRTEADRGRDLRNEAQNLALLQSGQTPLVGGENPVLHPSDFQGATPKRALEATPNPLATPFLKGQAYVPPSPAHIPGPANNEALAAEEDGAAQGVHALGSASKPFPPQASKPLSKGFLNLPAPKNEYQVFIPETATKVPKQDAFVEDMADVLVREEATKKARHASLLRMRTVPVQRGLPRPNLPLHVNQDVSQDANMVEASGLVQEEMSRLIRLDHRTHPAERVTDELSTDLRMESEFKEEELLAAKRKIDEEIGSSDANGAAPGAKALVGSIAAIKDQFRWSSSQRRFVQQESLNAEEMCTLAREEWSCLVKTLSNLQGATKMLAASVEARNQGSFKRIQEARKRAAKTQRELVTKLVELSSIKLLRDNEAIAGPARLADAREKLAALMQVERELQTRYADLLEAQQRSLS